MINKIKNDLKLLIALILLSRCGNFAYLSFFNLENEFGDRISPLISQTKGDIYFFSRFKNDAWGSLINLIEVRNYENYLGWILNDFYPGPLFPWLLNITDYTDGTTHILPIFFTCFSIINSLIWSVCLRRLNSNLTEQILVILYPNLIYYTAFISTDMPYCLFFSMFYYFLRFKERSALNYSIIFFMVVLCSLTRPNSLMLFPLLGYYLWICLPHFTRLGFIVAFLSAFLLGFLSLAYYLPYFLAYNNASSLITYWGVTQQKYLDGIFGFLPDLLNITFSWLILAFSKIIYLTGLRPSYSGMDNSIVLIRSVGSLMILPGIFYLLIRGNNLDKAIFMLFATPMLIGASQERYLLPICPILIYYGCRFWREFIKIYIYK